MIKAADSKYLKARYIDVDKNVEVGIYPVIFGWRVKAGYIDTYSYELDYCCGANQKMVETILGIVKTILEKYNCDFSIFPVQEIKPVFNDPLCFSQMLELAEGNAQLVEVPELQTLRKEIMSSMYDE